MNILLVDDEEHILQVLKDFLADCGYESFTASNGNEALSRLESGANIGLIVSDIRMPQMDGLEFLHAVRVRFPGVPVILITGHGDEQIAVSALQEGAFDYLKKPLKLEEFLSCVERVEARNQLETQLLQNYQDLLQSERDLPLNHSQMLLTRQTQQDVASVNDDLHNLETLWHTLRAHLNKHRPQNASEQYQLDFIIDEVPGLLVNIRHKIERLVNVSAQDPNRATGNRISNQICDAN